ncbi:MAG: TetR/AcrR family transcriptional regulator [Acidimicrobiia bacterium]
MSNPVSETKTHILKAALKRFADHGYAGVSLNDIAEDVGIKKPTILHHFSSKEALYRAVILDEFSDWVFLMTDAIGKNLNGWDQVEQLLRAAFTFFEQHPYFVRIARREALDPESLFSTELGIALKPLVEQGSQYLQSEMDAGRLNYFEPRQLLITGYGASLSYLSDASLVNAVIDGDPLSKDALQTRREHVLAIFKKALDPSN